MVAIAVTVQSSSAAATEVISIVVVRGFPCLLQHFHQVIYTPKAISFQISHKSPICILYLYDVSNTPEGFHSGVTRSTHNWLQRILLYIKNTTCPFYDVAACLYAEHLLPPSDLINSQSSNTYEGGDRCFSVPPGVACGSWEPFHPTALPRARERGHSPG